MDPPPSQEVDEEFAFHVEMRARELERKGWSREQARAAAVERFGRIEEVKAVCARLGEQRNRKARWEMALGGLVRDVKQSFRQMARTPVLAGAAVLTLAVGIGATTAVFTVVNGVLLEPLPFPDAERLVEIRTRYLPPSGFDIDRFPMSVPELVDYRDANRSFERVGLYRTVTRTMVGGDADPERVPTVLLDRAALEVLNVPPLIGRWFTAEEDRPGVSVGLLGYDLWRNRLGSDSTLVGRTIRISGRPFVVTGVMPPDFAFPDRRFQIFENFGLDPGNPGNRASHGIVGIGRLRPGVGMERVENEARTIQARWAEVYPHNVAHFPIFEPLTDNLVGTDVQRALLVLLMAVVVVLLIAAANVANLLMARGESRHPEIAIRSSLGASRGRIIRQLLTEGLTLAIAGAGLGVLLGTLGLRALLRIDPGALPRPEMIQLDGSVLGVAALVTLGTAILFGLAPALQAGRVPAAGLGVRGSSADPSSRRFRRALVAIEVGLSLVVVIAAGLVLRSFDEMVGIDPGVAMAGGLTFPLLLESDRYPDGNAIAAFHEELSRRLDAMAGVRAATVVSHLPLSGSDSRNDFLIDGRPEPAQGEAVWSAQLTAVLPGYFETMGLPTVQGRVLRPSDGVGAEPVVVVSQGVVDEYFDGADPLGQRVAVARDSVVWARVVGVVPDTRTDALDADVIPQIYFTLAQASTIAWPHSFLHVAVKTEGAGARLAPAIRAAVREMDPSLPVSEIRTLEQVRDASVARLKLMRNLLGLFGLMALALAAIGIYGVVSYSVSRRTREIGIRMALGEPRRRVTRLMIGEGAGPALAGILGGVPVSLLASSALSGLLFRVSPRDPGVYLIVSLGLVAIAVGSSWIPARRAAGLAPTEALRSE